MNSKPLKKTRTFEFNRSCSMEKPILPQREATKYVPNKCPVLEFPTSPQLIRGQEILHFSHPQHPLLEIELPDLFTCSGCKEYGAGKRFFCPQCDFQLHPFCALAPTSLNTHPLHTHHQLLFHSKPPAKGFMQSKCGVCVKPVKGFNFQCKACSFQMHPCCAMLSGEIKYPGHVHALKIVPDSTFNYGDGVGFVCGECKRKRSGRVYHCSSGICDYHLHAVCAKNMVNGLYDNGIKGKEKPGMLGTAAKIASQVMVDFIGGLMEGLGEGVGQAIIGQSVARGNPGNTRRRSRIRQ